MTVHEIAFGGHPWGAFALGILTAMQPCALAAVTAQVGWVFSLGATGRAALARGAALVGGMCVAYAAATMIASWLTVSIPVILKAVTLYIRPFFGPVLLLAGALVTGLFGDRRAVTPRFPSRVERLLGGLAASVAMGILMAGAMCPATAGIFFLLLIPATILGGHPIQSGLLYGLGTALPMLAMVAIVVAGGKSSASLRPFAGWIRRGAGIVMLAVGGFLTLRLIIQG